MTREEVLEGIDDPLWFVAYPHALQQVSEAMCRQQWEWPVGKMPEVGVSPLVHVFWEEMDVELAVHASCVKLCWELPERSHNLQLTILYMSLNYHISHITM